MGIKVIEGLWEEVAPQVRLAGRNVRIVYQEGPDAVVTLTETPKAPPATSGDPWLKQLIDFSNSHQSPAREIDLDRDRLFEELHGDRG